MSQLDGMALLLGDDAPQKIETAGASQRLNGMDLLLGNESAAAPNAQFAEPDAPTWLGRRWQDIRGKQDPRYKDLPTFDTYKAFNPDEYFDPRGGASIDNAPYFGADDAQLSDVIKNNLGDRFVGMKTDANGYPIVTYKDPQGQEVSAYVNRPGLDLQDVGRTMKGALPYLMVGGRIAAATKSAPLVVQVPAQVLGAMTTSITGDTALMPMGSERGIDAEKAVITGVGAGVGQLAAPVVGVIWRRFVTEPGLIDSAGNLTARGAKAAQEAGIDPASVTPDMIKSFAKELARTGDAAVAGNAARSSEFGIEKTLGETTGRADQLLREQRVRGGTYGEAPAAAIKAFDDAQYGAVGNAFAGDVPSVWPTGGSSPTIAKRIAPNRTAADYAPSELGGAIRENMKAASTAAREAEETAWKGVGTITATDEALAGLPQAINKALDGRVISGGAGSPTPTAARMVDALSSFMKGEAPEAAADWLTKQAPRNVDQMRRHLGGMIEDAATKSDRTAAGKIYDGFNSWIRDSADKLAMTDPNGAANLVVARGISKEAKEALQGATGTPASRILAAVLEKEDTAEGVVRALFAQKPGATKNGVSDALASLKTAYDKYLPADAAKSAWDDVRLAYWLRITQGKDGNPVGVQQFLTNLGRARTQEATVFNTLLTAPERTAILRLERTVRGLEKKNLNRSWTGPSVGGMFADITRALGFNTFAGRIAAGLVSKPIQYATGQAEVGRALATRAAADVPEFLAPVSAAAGATYGSRDH